MLEIVPNIWLFQINSLYLPRQKVAFGYPGKFPAREQDLIDTTPRKRVSIFMMLTSYFLYSQLPSNRLVTNLHNQADL